MHSVVPGIDSPCVRVVGIPIAAPRGPGAAQKHRSRMDARPSNMLERWNDGTFSLPNRIDVTRASHRIVCVFVHANVCAGDVSMSDMS